MAALPLDITLEFTPNPNTLKYSLNRTLLVTGSEYFTSLAEAEPWSPLGVKLFNLGGITAVMFGQNFLTVTLENQDNLRVLNRAVIDTVRAHVEAGEVAVRPRDAVDKLAVDDDVSRRIREIIDTEVRPAVAQDGGDIIFERFTNGVVYLNMHGACAGCPSSTQTLKAGIETRLQALIPEVREVVAI